MDCNTCKERRKEIEPVQYYVHEGVMARMERSNKRWFIAWLITFVLLVGCVCFFFWRESQFETKETTTTTTEVEQETNGEGSNNFYGGDYYGSAESQNNNDQNENQNP